jgi:hypothetical protein
VILPPYGGAWLSILTSLYPGYHSEAGPVSLITETCTRALAVLLQAQFSVGFNLLSKDSNFTFNFHIRRMGEREHLAYQLLHR